MAEDGSEALITALVPPGVTCCEQIGTLGGSLLRNEMDLLSSNTVSKRREEFAAGRTCARTALAKLGIAPISILQGSQGEPLWPEHTIGSITHCTGYCAAAVMSQHPYRGLGIDAESNEALPVDVLRLIGKPEELQWISNMTDEDICWDRLLFSIKESVYKVWYPQEHCWLDFHQACVEIDRETETFRVNLDCPGLFCPQTIEGRFVVTRSLILSCAWV